MKNKERLRKKYLLIRKKRYFEISSSFFNPLTKLIQKKFHKRSINLSCYYPASYEVNVLKLFESNLVKNLKILLPVLKSKNLMHFCEWNKQDVMQINTFGMLEPFNFSKNIIPNIMLIPLLAFDDNKNRLGYGGGFYDRYLNKYLNKTKNILTIGIAFSFQKHKKIPVSSNDVKLNYILTEKGLVKWKFLF